MNAGFWEIWHTPTAKARWVLTLLCIPALRRGVSVLPLYPSLSEYNRPSLSDGVQYWMQHSRRRGQRVHIQDTWNLYLSFDLLHHTLNSLVRYMPADLLPRLKPVGFLTLPGHSGRASLWGISAPIVHISFCVRAVIATVFCQDANLTTAITCVLSQGKNLVYHAARSLVCTRNNYYSVFQQINLSVGRQYGIHPTAKDRGLSACFDRNLFITVTLIL